MENYLPYVWIIVMVAMFYFMIIKPQKKKEKEDRKLRNSLAAGDQIVTIGGFTGRVLDVKEYEIVFETGAARTRLTVKKWAVQSRIPAENKKEEAKPEDK